jgi:hypothetical protein
LRLSSGTPRLIQLMITPVSYSPVQSKVDLHFVTRTYPAMNLRSLLPCGRLCQQILCKPRAQSCGLASMSRRLPVMAAASKAAKGTGNPENSAEQKVRTRLLDLIKLQNSRHTKEASRLRSYLFNYPEHLHSQVLVK